jgi:hypothetical protein
MFATPIPAYLRQQVLQTTPAWWDRTDLHLDNIVSESYGGRTELNNLQPLCRTCNLVKGYRLGVSEPAGVVEGHGATSVDDLAALQRA